MTSEDWMAEAILKGLITPAAIADTGPPPNLPIAPLEDILAELDRDREDRFN